MALVTCLKGIFCKSIGRLYEAKRACFDFELCENSLQILRNLTSKKKNECKTDVNLLEFHFSNSFSLVHTFNFSSNVIRL